MTKIFNTKNLIKMLIKSIYLANTVTCENYINHKNSNNTSAIKKFAKNKE